MSRPLKLRRIAAFLLAVITLFALPIKASAAPQIVYRHASRNGQKRVALTFDDGPHPRYTPEILNILAEYGVEATFFTVGSNAELYPHIIKRLLEEGHELGNHTYHHYHTVNVSGEKLKKDIIICNDTLERLTGEPVYLFRPPEGVFNEEIKQLCADRGYVIVMWSVDTRDWAHTSVTDICKNIKENVKDGSIILMHDFIGKNSPTPAALRRIIPMLQESGYEFVTVSRLLEG